MASFSLDDASEISSSLALLLMSGVQHDRHLPAVLCEKIPRSEATILRFFLAFLEAEGLADAPLLIAGGYVRDLLLGKVPDDLDLAICLEGAPEGVTVASLLERVEAFAAARPDLAIERIQITTILSDESKSKQLDTVKVNFTVAEDGGGDGGKIEVDVMPTIGEEVYEEGNRIPTRNQRGSIEEDALRRDLTIGAMLLRVERAAEGAADEAAAAEGAAAPALAYRLIDHYGGVKDLSTGTLRSPVPHGAEPDGIAAQVLQKDEQRALAAALGLLGAEAEGAAAADPPLTAALRCQALWWVKVLVDDPLRLLRCLRFAAKLDFAVHGAFWLAVPFAVAPLRSKVAGSRKLTELLKIARYGPARLSAFFRLALGRSFRGAQGDDLLGMALLGGQDQGGTPHSLPDVSCFDDARFEALSSAVAAPPAPADEALGVQMALAVACCTFRDGAVAAISAFHSCCDGLSASNSTRGAGAHVLEAAAALAAPLPSPAPRDDAAFAAAAGVSEAEFAGHVRVWGELRVAKLSPETLRHRSAAALALVADDAVARRFEAISGGGASVSGRALGALPFWPVHLRGQLIAKLSVLARLRRVAGDIATEEALRALAGDGLERGLREALFEEGGGGEPVLREEFRAPRKEKKAKKPKKQRTGG